MNFSFNYVGEEVQYSQLSIIEISSWTKPVYSFFLLANIFCYVITSDSKKPSQQDSLFDIDNPEGDLNSIGTACNVALVNFCNFDIQQNLHS